MPANSIWNIGLKYLMKGTTIGLLLTVLSYIVNIQSASGAPAALQTVLLGDVTITYTVVFWVWIIVLFFMVLGFTFDMIRMRRPE